MPTTNRALLRRFENVAAKHAARVGANIKTRREEMGITQSRLARELPGSPDGNQVSRWERGLHMPNVETLEKIAEVLRCDYSDLVSLPATTPTPYPPGGVEEMMEHFAHLEEIAKGHAGQDQVEEIRAQFRDEVGEMQGRLAAIEKNIERVLSLLREQAQAEDSRQQQLAELDQAVAEALAVLGEEGDAKGRKRPAG